MDKSFNTVLSRQLLGQGVKEQDVEYILSLIRTGDLDENLKILNNDVFDRLRERNLEKDFIEACDVLRFDFTHYNGPER